MFLAFLDEKLPHDKSQKYDFKSMLSQLDKYVEKLPHKQISRFLMLNHNRNQATWNICCIILLNTFLVLE